jgi:argininosuccinate lyase
LKTLATSLNQNQAEGFYQVTQGMDADPLLYREEIEVQKAWIKGLTDAALLRQQEQDLLLAALDAMASEMRNGSFLWRIEDEDIHMSIERALTEKLGEVGKKIHLGRSRNDLIATTLKLYFANRAEEISKSLIALSQSLLAHAERDLEIILPAYTHSQAAQPIRMAHVWNFHALNFLNDLCRLQSVRKNLLRVMPLGSGAIAGTHIPIELAEIARALGFQSPPINSIHGVSDRDGLIELSSAIATLGVHITRICEDVIHWSSTSMKILDLPKQWSSGSSMMPNKRNPDFFEISRAKAKRMVALNFEVLSLNIGLTSGYASDLHEQKIALISGVRDLQSFLPNFTTALSQLTMNSRRAEELLGHGHVLATDIANDLVSQGITFRDAYRKVADLISLADQQNQQVGTEHCTYKSAIENRSNSGGTAKACIQKSMEWIRAELQTLPLA